MTIYAILALIKNYYEALPLLVVVVLVLVGIVSKLVRKNCGVEISSFLKPVAGTFNKFSSYLKW